MTVDNTCGACAGTVQVDAHNVMLTLCEFSYVALPFGIATAATIRVGNMLGAGNHASARRSGAARALLHLDSPALACTCRSCCEKLAFQWFTTACLHAASYPQSR